MRRSWTGSQAFTLIELLIVVAIIAILAAIAVPNFLEAQTRSKVSRVRSDMRTIVTGLEAYAVDNNKLPDIPRAAINPGPPLKLLTPYSRATLSKLSTPVAYLTSGLFVDIFATGAASTGSSSTASDTAYFGYVNTAATEATIDLGAVGASTDAGQKAAFDEHGFVLQSVGPDTINYAYNQTDPNQGFARAYEFLTRPQNGTGWNFRYDPTNGTISDGDLIRTRKING